VRLTRLGRRWRRSALILAAFLTPVAATAGTLPTTGAAFTATTKNTSDGFGASSSFYRDTVLPDNPSGYWRLGETAATESAADASAGGANAGTYVNEPLLGASGASRDGDTASDTSGAGYGLLPRLVSTDLSIEAWFNTTATSKRTGAGNWVQAPFMILGSFNYCCYTRSFGMALTGDGRVVAGTGESLYTLASPSGTAYNDGNWHHVIFTRVQSSGAVALYVDGSSKATGTTGTGTLDASPTIGLGIAAYNGRELRNPFDGRIDEVAQYSTALSASRVSAHYAARNSGYTTAVTTDSPAGYWRLADTAGAGITAAATTGGTAAAGSVGSRVLRGQSGATGDGNASMRFQPAPSQLATVPRLITDDFTLEARFRTSETRAWFDPIGNWYSGGFIVGAREAQTSDGFGISVGSDGLIGAGIANPNTTIASPAGTRYDDGNWHSVALTRVKSSGALKLYVDGAQVATGTGGTQSMTGPAKVNISQIADYDAEMKQFSGVVSDVAQYTTALSATRIAAHNTAATSQSAYRTSVQDDSPAGYWPLSDTSGTTVTALVGGAANNGTVAATVRRGVTTPTGTGMLFTQANWRGVTVPRLVSGDFSLEAWFTATVGLSGGFWWSMAPIIGGDASGTVADFGLALDNQGSVVYGETNDTPVVNSGTGLNDGAWHHVVVTRTSSTGAVKLYVDGAQVDTGTGPTGNLTASAVLGLGYNPADGKTFDGTVDEVAQYTTVLSAAQVLQHYQRGA
jgi:Concanavalin A-like lectin/glucanases superfamily